MKVLLYSGLALLILKSCSGRAVAEEAVQSLLVQERKIKCELKDLKADITDEWDGINIQLEKSLPADVLEEEKDNMLRVRNANLIRMFESFKDFDEEVKEHLKNVEIKDQKISTRIHELRKEMQMIEANKMLLFDEISRKEGKPAIAQFQATYLEALQEPCD